MSAIPSPSRPSTAGRPGRSSAEIRRDIDAQRQELGSRSRRCAAASPS